MIIIKIWGPIGRDTSNLVDLQLAQLKDDKEPIIVLINSEGGTLIDAIVICNLLKAVPNKKITINLGLCASAAAMIFACGKSRYVASDSEYMIHQPLINPGEGFQNYTETGRIQSELKQSLSLYRKYVTRKAKIPKELLDKAFVDGLDVKLTDKECLKYEVATDKFTTWKNLYKKEKIDIVSERVVTFDIPQETDGCVEEEQ